MLDLAGGGAKTGEAGPRRGDERPGRNLEHPDAREDVVHQALQSLSPIAGGGSLAPRTGASSDRAGRARHGSQEVVLGEVPGRGPAPDPREEELDEPAS